MKIPSISGEKAQALYKLMYYFDEFCTKYKIVYWTDGGTTLGAVRHKGIITWDDDLDLQLNTENYKKLVSLEKELNKEGFRIDYEKNFGNLMKISFLKDKPLGPKKPWSFPFIDIFKMKLSSDKSYYEYSRKEWRGLRGGKIFIKDVFPLKRAKFCSNYVWIPHNAEKYLKESYGPKVLEEGYFQGFHTGEYASGEREMVGKTFKPDKFTPAMPCYDPSPHKELSRRELQKLCMQHKKKLNIKCTASNKLLSEALKQINK